MKTVLRLQHVPPSTNNLFVNVRGRGRVKSEEAITAALSSQTDECVLWPHSTNGRGYGQFRAQGKALKAHRAVCSLAHGEPPNGSKSDAAHSCGNRLCINPRHLRWADRSQNMEDSRQHGTMAIGEGHGNAKVTSADIEKMRNLRERGWSQKAIAAIFKVSRSNVSLITRFKSRVSG